MAAAIPISDANLGGTLALALSSPSVPVSYSDGLLVATGTSKADVLAALKKPLDQDTFHSAKLAYALSLLSKTSFNLGVALANGFDLDAPDISLDQAKTALASGLEPAFAVVAPSDD